MGKDPQSKGRELISAHTQGHRKNKFKSTLKPIFQAETCYGALWSLNKGNDPKLTGEGPEPWQWRIIFLTFCITKNVFVEKLAFLIMHESRQKYMQIFSNGEILESLGAGLGKLMWNLNACRYLYHIFYTSWHQVCAQISNSSGLVLD